MTPTKKKPARRICTFTIPLDEAVRPTVVRAAAAPAPAPPPTLPDEPTPAEARKIEAIAAAVGADDPKDYAAVLAAVQELLGRFADGTRAALSMMSPSEVRACRSTGASPIRYVRTRAAFGGPR